MTAHRIHALIATVMFAPLLLLAQSKPKITKEEQLPRFTYEIAGKAEEFVESGEAFASFLEKVQADVEGVLRDYDIQDTTTRQRLLTVLMNIDLLSDRYEEAEQRHEEIQKLEEKEARRLVSRALWSSIFTARRASDDPASPEFQEAFRAALSESVGEMPWNVVEMVIRQINAATELMREEMFVGGMRARIDPVIKETGRVSSQLAHRLINVQVSRVHMVPTNDAVREVFGSYITANQSEPKPDIWAGRDVQLEEGADFTPVRVAVWDTGIDLSLFPQQIAKDESGEPLIIAFGLYGRPSDGELQPLSNAQKEKYPEERRRFQGYSDMMASIESDAAASLKRYIGSLTPDEVKAMQEERGLFGNYMHGTHVAGITVNGNPYARLVVGRLTWDDWKAIPELPTIEKARRCAKSYSDAVQFFERQGVRVVNMSWSEEIRYFERLLELNGAGRDSLERKNVAKEIFDILAAGLRKAIGEAPGIVFVASAGNSDSDASFDQIIPSGFELPNLITVGAVDKAGKETSFTSFGPTVAVHANGYQVESFVPGGERLRLSGTSMAAPNVVNLAAKMLATDPSLTPPEVIEIIKATATPSEDGRLRLIHPKNALAKAHERREKP